jgi:uncharacterized protein GlcG (DUF336 family)
MSLKFTAGALALAALFAAGAAQAQQQPNPLDNIPEKLPFDVPYGAPISLDRADAVLTAALTEAKKRGWPLGCAVMDSGAQLVALKRMDGAALSSTEVSQHKARAAARYRRETKIFENGIQGGFTYLATLDGVVGARGGIPLLDGGKIIGAIGCSGGTGSQDEVAAKAGVAALK